MEQLRTMSIQENQLSGTIPSSYFSIPYLRTLELGENELSGSLPTKGYNSSQLGILRLARNNLTGSIPPAFGSLTNLELLNIGENNFSGTVPDFFATMPRLEYLNIYKSGLEAIPEAFCSFTSTSITIVTECATTRLCSCCDRSLATFAPIKIRCSEDLPDEGVLGFGI